MKTISIILALIVSCLFFGCGTTDASLKDQGRNSAYIQGFHDGRHSGMSEEGNNFEHYIRDEARFQNDHDYKQGWGEGEAEGMLLQDQAVAVGSAIGGTYSTIKVNQAIDNNTNFDKIAKDSARGVDTSNFKDLK